MSTRRAAACLLFFVVWIAVSALAQNAPAGPPANNGPSLDVTMKFIQDGLEGMNYTYSVTTASSEKATYFTTNVTSVQADVAKCSLTWRNRTRLDFGNLYFTYEREVTFKDVATVQVVSMNEADASQGTVYKPDVFAVRLNGAWGKKFSIRSQYEMPDTNTKKKKHSSSDETDNKNASETKLAYAEVAFSDEQMANRMAKALWHAVELCGGGRKEAEPF